MEEALTGIDGVAEACVVGLPTSSGEAPSSPLSCLNRAGSRAARSGWTAPPCARPPAPGWTAPTPPKRVVVLQALPLRPSGKVDRREVARLLATTTTDVTSEPLTPGP